MAVAAFFALAKAENSRRGFQHAQGKCDSGNQKECQQPPSPWVERKIIVDLMIRR